MAKIASSINKEGFLVQVNGDYNVPFEEVEVTGTFKSGTVLESASAAADADSAVVFGILAEDVTGTDVHARVMVRGNPSTVNAQELVYGTAVASVIDPLLAAKGIVVVNA